MDCKEMEIWISALMDGELTPEERAPVEEHLEGCEGCRKTLEAYQSVGEIYRFRAETSVAPVMPEVHTGRRIRFPIPARVAALLILAFSVLFLMDPFNPRSSPAVPVSQPTTVSDLETDLPDATLVVYKDVETDWLIILVDSPVEDAG